MISLVNVHVHGTDCRGIEPLKVSQHQIGGLKLRCLLLANKVSVLKYSGTSFILTCVHCEMYRYVSEASYVS